MEYIKINLQIPNKEFSKIETILSTIRMSDINENIRELTFSYNIPKHIFEKVANTSDIYKTEVEKFNPSISFAAPKPKFKRIISDVTLKGLIDKIETITQDAMLEHELEEAQGKKVLCIKFARNQKHEVGTLNHADMGLSVSSKFQFFIAFKYTIMDFGTERNIYKGLRSTHVQSFIKHNQSELANHHCIRQEDSFENNFQIIPWTQDREDFLTNIQSKFIELNDKLDNFLGNLDEQKIDLLINNQTKLLNI
jgi:hypothetical protein